MGILEGKLTYKELAEILPYSVSYLRRLVFDKKIPYYKMNRNVFFDKDEIEKWLEDKFIHHAEENNGR